MKFGSALIGSVIGGLLGAAGWFMLETQLHREAEWAPVLIGVLSGLGARWLSASSAVSPYLRGAIAAAVGFAAMIGSHQAITKQVIQDVEKQRQATPVATIDLQEGEDEAEEDGEDDGDDVAVPRDSTDAELAGQEAPSLSTKIAPPGTESQTYKLAAYYGVGTLLAYFFGKGKKSGCCAAPAATEPV